MIQETNIQPILITTGHNKVRRYLQSHYPNLKVIDCEHMDKHLVLKAVSCLPGNMLITYRCPYILPLRCIEGLAFGGYNIHPTLLPKYAGLNPWEAIFLNKEKESGVTIHRLTEKVDEGEILIQRTFQITDSDTIESAREKADYLAAEMAACFFPALLSDSTMRQITM